MSATSEAPKNRKRSALTIVLAVVSIALVVLATLFATGFLRQGSSSTPISGPVNVQIDHYPAGSNYSGQYGDEPYVTVAPNGTIYVVWIGYDLIAPPSPNQSYPTFATAIWIASSSDGGRSYSTPDQVSPPAELFAFDPSVAVLPDGAIAVAWGNNSAPSGLDSIVVATLAPGAKDFTDHVPIGQTFGLDRPWISSSPNGTLFLAYALYLGASGYFVAVYWTESEDSGATFSYPQLLMPGWPAAVVPGPSGTFWVSALDPFATQGADGWTSSHVDVGTVDLTNGTSSLSLMVNITQPYPLDFTLTKEWHPGPSLAVMGSRVVVAYATENATELVWNESADGGGTWSPGTILEGEGGASFRMPWVFPLGNDFALSWESNSTGYWNTYSAVFDPNGTPVGPVVMVSSQNGYPGTVLNWHGDFIGAAAIGSTQYVVLWGDGRGLTNIYGLGHIYGAVVNATG